MTYIKKWLYPQKIYRKGIEGRELKLDCVSHCVSDEERASDDVLINESAKTWIKVLIPSVLFPCYKFFVDIITFLSYYFTELVKINLTWHIYYIYILHKSCTFF